MIGSGYASPQFPVGDSRRPLLGRALLGSLLVGVLFTVFTWSTKELRGLYVHEPWQDDPYDAVVSFALFFVSLLTGLCMLRVPMCRREAPLPLRRALDLLRASRVLVAVVLITLLSDWISVVLQAHRTAWDTSTAVNISILACLTVLTLAVARQLRRATAQPLRDLCALDMPDWQADAVALGERAAARLGPMGPIALRMLRLIDDRVAGAIRRHPLRAAATFALAFGFAVSTGKAVAEGYVLRELILFFTVAAGGMFAFVGIVGGYLRLAGASGRPPRRAVSVILAACASLPLTIAFRGPIWSLLGSAPRQKDVLALGMLLLVIAAISGVGALAAESLLRRRPASE